MGGLAAGLLQTELLYQVAHIHLYIIIHINKREICITVCIMILCCIMVLHDIAILYYGVRLVVIGHIRFLPRLPLIVPIPSALLVRLCPILLRHRTAILLFQWLVHIGPSLFLRYYSTVDNIIECLIMRLGLHRVPIHLRG